MRRIDTQDGLFHQSKPGDPLPSTRVTDWWLNGVQEEIINVITRLGKQEVNANDNTQLARAIEYFFKFGEAPTVIDIGGQISTPVATPLDLEKDGGYFYVFSVVLEQFTTPNVILTPFDLIAFKDSISHKWKIFQKPFDPAQKLPIAFSITDSGQVFLATTSDWWTGKGKIHLVINKRERLA